MATLTLFAWILGAPAALGLVLAARRRLQLSRAKHPSLAGHPRLAKRLATMVPFYDYDEQRFFSSDGASDEVVEQRRAGFLRLSAHLRRRAPETLQRTKALAPGVSDLQFIDSYRVPYQYSRVVRRHLEVGAFVRATDGVRVYDLDGNEAYDLAGSYGLNVFGYDFYKSCLEAGAAKVRELGPVLGAYHPVIAENVRRLREISGLDEVSFHMSGTEAVMQAVRLARYHTRRSHLVRFAGAYHGWWDGVQPGVGNPRPVGDAYTLREMDTRTLCVLRTRRNIACVLVNPLQALHPNAAAPADGTLVASDRSACVDLGAYTAWLRDLRRVCTERGIVLIFDEVFVGFRLAYGGAQEYFGVAADLVTYGKTLGGGLPVGVLCGKASLMRRFDPERPADVCFARGTFNSHPYVMGAMHEFLERVSQPALQAQYARAHEVWAERTQALNARLAQAGLPVRVANLVSIWTVRYTVPSRYNWMLQYYMRAEALVLSWVGTGRLIFSHSYSDADFAAVADRMVAAARAMKADGWWSGPPLTNAAIRQQVLRETLSAMLGRRRRRHAGATDAHPSLETGPS